MTLYSAPCSLVFAMSLCVHLTIWPHSIKFTVAPLAWSLYSTVSRNEHGTAMLSLGIGPFYLFVSTSGGAK